MAGNRYRCWTRRSSIYIAIEIDYRLALDCGFNTSKFSLIHRIQRTISTHSPSDLFDHFMWFE